MFNVDVSTLFAVHLFVWTGTLLFLWIWQERRKGIELKENVQELIWHCSICTNVYVDSRNRDLSKCPQCQSYNKRSDWEAIENGKNK